MSFILFLYLTVSFSTSLQSKDIPFKLIEYWYVTNTLCRGYSDVEIVEPSCQARDALGRKIFQAGYCYGRHGEATVEWGWHQCAEDSIQMDSEPH